MFFKRCKNPVGLATLLLSALAMASPSLELEPGSIAEGRFNYVTALQIGDNSMDIPSSREIRHESVDQHAILRIETTTTTGMGETVDRLRVDAFSLYPIERDIVQGDGHLQLAYTSDHVSGLIRAAGQVIRVDLPLDAPAYAGDAGLDTLLAALPLKAGLSGDLRIIETDVEVYVQVFEFHVAPAEMVEVPAGRFESWPVHVQAREDPDYRQTVWISTATPRMFVQAQAPVPKEAGGGTLVTRLLSSASD